MVSQGEFQELMVTGLKTWFHDALLGSEQMDWANTQTGTVTHDVQQLLLETGYQQGSTVRANYTRQFFNPLYSSLFFKMRVSDMDDHVIFAGFAASLLAPEWPLTLPTPDWAKSSFSGIMLLPGQQGGTLYFITGDGALPAPHIQVTPIPDIDMTRWLIYRIDGETLKWYSLPYTVPYFDKNVEAGLKQGIVRKWSLPYVNGSAIPGDVMHYIVFYAENTTGTNKQLELQFIDYAEVYPD